MSRFHLDMVKDTEKIWDLNLKLNNTGQYNFFVWTIVTQKRDLFCIASQGRNETKRWKLLAQNWGKENEIVPSLLQVFKKKLMIILKNNIQLLSAGKGRTYLISS